MSENNSSAATGGGSIILGLLGVAFVVLKLCHVINWSWWWVTAPFWIGPAVLLLIGVGALLIWGTLRLLESKQDRQRRELRESMERYSSAIRRR